MPAWIAATNAIAVAIAVLLLVRLLMQRDKSDAELLFAVVCGSLALSLMQSWMSGAPEWMKWAVAIGGSATCNGFWLVSRALFRGEGGVRLSQVLFAAGVALLIAIHRGNALDGGISPPVLTVVIDALLTLTSTSLLALSFIEPLRGWSRQWLPTERRMRLAFVALYGASVLSTTLLGALADAFSELGASHTAAVAICASAMLIFTDRALRYRRRAPLHAIDRDRRVSGREGAGPDEDGTRLEAALKHQLQVLQAYREPELRVTELAARVGTAEHRLSRFITQRLGEKNFNQMLNRYRVAHACRLLAMRDGFGTVLDVSFESGFASLGPFNRAFKSLMGCTPTAYRTACLAGKRPHPPPIESPQPRALSATSK